VGRWEQVVVLLPTLLTKGKKGMIKYKNRKTRIKLINIKNKKIAARQRGLR